MKLNGLVWLGCTAAAQFRETTISATHIQQLMQEFPEVEIQYWTSDSREPMLVSELPSPAIEEAFEKATDKIFDYLIKEFQVAGIHYNFYDNSDYYDQLSQIYTRVFPDTDGMVTLNFTIRDDKDFDETNDSANWFPEGWANTIVDAWRSVKVAMFQ